MISLAARRSRVCFANSTLLAFTYGVARRYRVCVAELAMVKPIFMALAFMLAGCGSDESTGNHSEAPYQPVNPQSLSVAASGDTGLSADSGAPVSAVTSFSTTKYFTDDSVVRFSDSFDTLRFVYQSMEDDVYSNVVDTVNFTVTQRGDGVYLIQGKMTILFSDAVSVGPQWKHSFSAGAVFPGGFPKGNYRFEMQVSTGCFCFPQPSPSVFTTRFSLR